MVGVELRMSEDFTAEEWADRLPLLTLVIPADRNALAEEKE